MQTEAGQFDSEDPRVLQARVLKILQVARELPRGALRRDALAEVSRLRLRSIQLQRRTAAELKVKIATRRGDADLKRVK